MRGIGRWSVACPCSMVCPPPAPAMGGPRLFTPRPPRTRALSSVFMTRLHNARQLIAGNKNLIFNGNIWNITHQHEVDNEFHCFVGQWNCPVGGNFVDTVDRGLELSTQRRDIARRMTVLEAFCGHWTFSRSSNDSSTEDNTSLSISIKAAKSCWMLNIGVSIHPECLFKTFSACRWLQWPPYICRRVRHKPVDSYLQWQCGPQPGQ